MKGIKLVLILLIGFFACKVNGTTAQNPKNKETNNIVSEDRKNGDWFLYVEDAYQISKKSGKPILANFTGSDWCGWCIRLKNEVFKTEEFKNWANSNVVLLELDFPRKTPLSDDLKSQNAGMQQAFQVGGYPTLWIFNLEFNETTKQFNIDALGKTGYVAGGPTEWIGQTKTILNQKK
jgi:protein disulfide-isomerase